MKKPLPRLRLFIRWGIALFILLLLFLLLSQFDIQNFLYSLNRIPLFMIALLLCVQIISQLLVNLQWRITAFYSGTPISFWKMFYVNCQGSVMDSITPGVKIGGEITRAILLGRTAACSLKQAASIVALQKLFSLGAFFLVNLFVIGFVINASVFLVYSILLFFLLLFLSLFIMPLKFKSMLLAKEKLRFGLANKLKDFLLAVFDSIIVLRKNRIISAALFLLSIFIWLLYPLKLLLLIMPFLPGSANVFFDSLQIAGITFTSYLVAMIPIFPGGLGGFEGTMSGLLLAIGVQYSDSLAVTLVFRFATFWFVLILSLCFAAFYRLFLRRVQTNI
jgi:uncharacterized protein (TIRG00374 family)